MISSPTRSCCSSAASTTGLSSRSAASFSTTRDCRGSFRSRLSPSCTKRPPVDAFDVNGCRVSSIQQGAWLLRWRSRCGLTDRRVEELESIGRCKPYRKLFSGIWSLFVCPPLYRTFSRIRFVSSSFRHPRRHCPARSIARIYSAPTRQLENASTWPVPVAMTVISSPLGATNISWVAPMPSTLTVPVQSALTV
jgi:hypothetical protein